MPLTRKDTNPKEACGVKKVPRSTVSAPVVAELGLAMLEGARKYGRHNYRVCGVRHSTYYDAVNRHLDAWWEGEDIDDESGLHHLTKAMACLAVLRDSMIMGNDVDDRPPRPPEDWQANLNARAEALIERIPEAKAACVEGDQHADRCETCSISEAHPPHDPGLCTKFVYGEPCACQALHPDHRP